MPPSYRQGTGGNGGSLKIFFLTQTLQSQWLGKCFDQINEKTCGKLSEKNVRKWKKGAQKRKPQINGCNIAKHGIPRVLVGRASSRAVPTIRRPITRGSRGRSPHLQCLRLS